MPITAVKRNLFVAALCATAFSLAVSVWLLSLFTIIALIIWLWDKGPLRIELLCTSQRNILIFTASWLVYLAWMINTYDLSFGLRELKLKLPLLVFPLIIGLSSPLIEKELRWIMASFISGVIVSSVYGVAAGGRSVFSGLADPRILSPFISHIRLALMAVFCIFISAWYIFTLKGRNGWKGFFLLSAVWTAVFLFLLLSLTGIVVFTLIFILSLYIVMYRNGNKALRFLYPVLIISLFFISFIIIYAEVRSFYKPGTAYSMPAAEKTGGGNVYTNELSRKDIESGNRVWIYICEKELSNAWNKLGSIPYDSLDKKGQALRYTLIRYMTSAGLKKDSAGVSHLDKTDIMNIEGGMTNKFFTVWSPWRKKIYELIWQIEYYRNGGNPSGHSVTQRLEFLKTGWQIFSGSPLFGIGTGDIASAYALKYTQNKSGLEPAFRLLCHNQFLTFLISFGLIGTLIICFSLFYPFFRAGGHQSYIPMVFFIIIFLSMLWEDTLETHIGITFFAYFYSVFIFGREKYEKI